MTARDETPDVALSEEERRVVLVSVYGCSCCGADSERDEILAAVERIVAARVAACEAARAEAEARAEREQRASAAYHEKWGQCALRLEEAEARVAESAVHAMTRLAETLGHTLPWANLKEACGGWIDDNQLRWAIEDLTKAGLIEATPKGLRAALTGPAEREGSDR